MLSLGREDAKHFGAGHGLALVGDIQFAVDMVCMLLYGAGRDVQPGLRSPGCSAARPATPGLQARARSITF